MVHSILKILLIAALFVPLASYTGQQINMHGPDRDILILAWDEQVLLLTLIFVPALVLRYMRIFHAPSTPPHEME